MSQNGKKEALALLQVSRETAERLTIFENLLRRWQPTVNLVSPSTMDDLWMRHIADSGQLVQLAPEGADVWADIGSGAGFPGAVIGIMLAVNPGAEVHLIESDQRKAAFLRTVSRETGVPMIVHCERAEAALAALPRVVVITSRAVASLAQLLAWTEPALRGGAIGLFLRGESVREELTTLKPVNSIRLSLTPSLTRPSSGIVVARASP